MAEELEEESEKSLKMEIALEKQLELFDVERKNMITALRLEEKK